MASARWAWIGALVVACAWLVGCEDEPSGTPDSGAPLLDQCLAAMDMEIVLAARGDGGVFDAGQGDPLTAAGACAIDDTCADLYFNGDIAGGDACVDACLDSSPVAGLSAECRRCYAVDARNCAAEHCLLDCLGNSTAGCHACFDQYCDDRLTACIGY